MRVQLFFFRVRLIRFLHYGGCWRCGWGYKRDEACEGVQGGKDRYVCAP